MSQDENQQITKTSGGVFYNLQNRIKLIFRLMADRRVSPFLKLIPIGSLAYFLIPDLVLGPIDDAVIIWLATVLFVELSPPDVVQEHLDALNRVVPSSWQEAPPAANPNIQTTDERVVDAEFWDDDSQAN
jgi:hypothetical protein